MAGGIGFGFTVHILVGLTRSCNDCPVDNLVVRCLLDSMNRGAQILAERLSERGAKRRLAEKLGISQAVVTNWLKGRLPASKTRAKLEDILGIRWTLWDEPARSSKGDAA
jgi:hypothetical protein